MAAAWRRGERPPAESFLGRHPELLDHPEEAVRLVYEEVCLRQECGQEITADELSRRFPRWTEELAMLLDCHGLMESFLKPPLFPDVGASLGDYRLVAELGRGSHGRVYLATQPALADRPVVLKGTPRRAREHLSLARLQHTHIIPLHAVHDFPERNLRAICMPFLGGAPLARVLELLRDRSVARRTGQSLVDALDAAARDAPVRLPGHGGYLRTFAAASYVEAVCCIGACLADGLHYAHERGLVHLDLKPSNVLLAADAQPLLLDFHLALHPLPAGRAAPEGLGGTPEYMSPEQERACAAARRGLPVPEAVDGRSDIYSLGRLLYAALAGDEAAPGRHPPPLHRRNPQVSVGLSDLVQRCLAPSPTDRYPDAAALAADLRRHLAHWPLQGVPNRSLRERWRKWRRRRPSAPLWLSLLLALTGTGALLTEGAVERYRDAQEALVEGQGQVQGGAYREAVRTLARGKTRAEGLPGGSRLSQALDRHLRQARRAQAAKDLHAVAESLRFLAGANVYSARELQTLEAHCRSAWEARGVVADPSAPLDPDTEEQLWADLYDLALLWAGPRQRGPASGGEGAGPEQVRALLAEAEMLVGHCTARAERQRPAEAEGSPAPAAARRATWEHVALGQSLLRSGELEWATEELEQATDLRPQDFWANFYRGVCAYRRKHYAEAVHSFGVAIALAPASAECYYNRALAYAAWGKKGQALGDYNRALALAPRLGAAALNRGVLHYQEGRLSQARADLEEALRQGVEPTAAHYNLALVHVAWHDPAGARRHLEQALRHNPMHAESRSLLDRLRQPQ
jgi:serine/threonine protein kinase/Flp pilus assembly protein TadD